jgi:cardiolipin synthase
MEAYETVVNTAETQILLNVYEFSSIAMAESLIQAKERGVEVIVLIEGGPVGGVSAEESYVCRMMIGAGIPIWQMTNTGTGHAPYRYNHAKYIVADGEDTLVTTENFGENGFPSTGAFGNRGWGVVIHDPGTAQYFRYVFLSDLNGPGIAPMRDKAGIPEESSGADSTSANFHPVRFSGANVTPILSPDSSMLIQDLIAGAREEILVEQAYITNGSDGEWNPYLAEVIDASRRGVQTRVLLDAYWFSVDGTEDNDEMAATINRLARSEGLPIEARCSLPTGGNVEKIHDKGVIIDGRRVLVSSINWNTNSPSFNREAGVIIDHDGVGSFFKDAFETDWMAAGPARGGSSGPGNPDLGKIGAAAGVLVLLVFLYWRRRCS